MVGMIAITFIVTITLVLAQLHIVGLRGIDGTIIAHITTAIQRCQYHIKTIKDWFPIRLRVHDAVIRCIIKYNKGDVMDKDTQGILDRITNNIKTADKTLLMLLFQSHEERLQRLEKKLKPGIYNILNLAIQLLQPIAILILAYVLSKMT